MPKIIKRIAEEQYCYTEIHFDSLEEYKAEYMNIVLAMVDNKLAVKKYKDEQEKNSAPF